MPAPATLRNGVDQVVYFATREIVQAWPTITTPAQLQEMLDDLLPAINTTYGEAAAALAAEWYEQDRDEHGVAGHYTARPVPIGSPGTAGTEALSGWAAKIAAQPGVDWAALQTLVVGGLQRRIANAARYTVTGSAIRDPGAHGWYRYTVGSSCDFCRDLAGRGAVYNEETVTFGAHDHCGCMAAPQWKGAERLVDAYKPTTRRLSEADKARTRAWIRRNIH